VNGSKGFIMLQVIPENMYKRVLLSKDIEATGYKSEVFDYSEGSDAGKRDNTKVSVNINLISDFNSLGNVGFRLKIDGRDTLLLLREAIDFALETREYNCVYCEDSGLAHIRSSDCSDRPCPHCKGGKNADKS